MEPIISTTGALIGLVVAILLIILKVTPAYSMIAGALLGGLLGGGTLTETVELMITGAQGIMPTILRIVTAGVLAGILMESGAATRIANTIVKVFGEKRALLAIALSTLVLTAVGVFGDVAVITVAPIALALGERIGYTSFLLLLALMGGEKAGMVISPNPQTIATAEGFDLDLFHLMISNIIPALVGLVATVFLCKLIEKKHINKEGSSSEEGTAENTGELPSIWASLLGPIVVVILLAIRPLFGIEVDPLVALPVGGIVGVIAMGKTRNLKSYLTVGLEKMMPVAVLLVGTGTLAGIIEYSNFQNTMTELLITLNLPQFLLAPIAGVAMAGATGSASTGATIASSTFSSTIVSSISPLAGGAMLHAGTIALDNLPHGSIFNATAGAMNMSVKERLKLLPYESSIGFIIVIVSTIIYGVIL
ncbi:MAG: GntP family permease [Tetragenococcus sp.]|nr:GntP family permease [Tetragenococcus sp.]